MKRTLLLLAAAILCFITRPTVVDAGTSGNANIIAVDVRNDGTFLIDVSQATTGAPSCATVTNRLSANANTAGGKALLQLAISAYLSGKLVNVDGTGACSEFSNIESIARIYAH